MSVSPVDVRDDLLANHLGQEILSLASPAHLKRILSDLNKAIQRIYAASKPAMRETESSCVLNAPTTISGLGLTRGSKVIAGWAAESWMIGATVLLDDDPRQNRILGSTSLLHPYLGTTGTRGGTAYGDIVVPGNNAVAIHAPVKLLERWDLTPALSRAAMDTGSFQGGYGTGENRPIDAPRIYHVEEYQDAQFAIRPRIRVTPLPDREYVLKYSVRSGAPIYTALTGTDPIPMPGGYGDSILLPIVRQMLSSHKDFVGDKGDVKTDADEAWKTLGSLNAMQGHTRQEIAFSPHW